MPKPRRVPLDPGVAFIVGVLAAAPLGFAHEVLKSFTPASSKSTRLWMSVLFGVASWTVVILVYRYLRGPKAFAPNRWNTKVCPDCGYGVDGLARCPECTWVRPPLPTRTPPPGFQADAARRQTPP